MTDSLLNIVIKATDLASGVLDKVNKRANNLAKQGLESINNGFQATANLIKTGLIAGLTGGALAFGIIGKGAIDGAAQFEMFRATLTTMLGSQELANERLKEYADIGAKTPFELPQVVALGNQLQAIGKYSRDNVNMLGDLASAAGKPIEQVSGAFAKLATGQKGIAVDMFRDLLITTDDWTKATGKGITKTGELMATTEEMMAVLPKIMADKKFMGMMEQQSQTFVGKMSNLVDAWSGKLREVGERILPSIKPYIDDLITYISGINLDNIFNALTEIFQLLKSGGQEAMDGGMWIDNLFGSGAADKIAFISQKLNEFYGFITSNTPASQAVLVGLATVVGTLVVGAFASMAVAVIAATWPFIALGVVIGGLYYLWQTNFYNMQGIAEQVFGVIRQVIEFLRPSFDLLIQSVNQLVGSLMDFWHKNKEQIIPEFQRFATFIGFVIVGAIWVAINALSFIISWLSQLVNAISQALQTGRAFLAWLDELRNKVFSMDFSGAGRQLMQGLINGITSMGSAVANAIGGIISNNVPKGLRDTLKNLPEVGGFFRGIPGFAEGGIVGGSSFSGDKILARVNSRELILNQRQQNNLVNQLESGSSQPITINVTIGSYMGTEKDKREIARDLAPAFSSLFPQLRNI